MGNLFDAIGKKSRAQTLYNKAYKKLLKGIDHGNARDAYITTEDESANFTQADTQIAPVTESDKSEDKPQFIQQKPGLFFAEANQAITDTLNPNVGSPQNIYYSSAATQMIVTDLHQALIMADSDPYSTQPNIPYDKLLDDYFSRPQPDSILDAHQRLDPIGLLLVNTSNALPDHYIEIVNNLLGVTPLLLDDATIFRTWLTSLDSQKPINLASARDAWVNSTFEQIKNYQSFLETARTTCQELYTHELISRSQYDQIIAYVDHCELDHNEKTTKADPSEDIEQQLIPSYIQGLQEHWNKIVSSDQSVVIQPAKLTEFIEAKRKDFRQRWAELYYLNYVATQGIRKQQQSDDGDLPTELQWHPNYPFETQQQFQLFQLLTDLEAPSARTSSIITPALPIGERDQDGLPITETRQASEIHLLEAHAKKGLSPPANAGALLSTMADQLALLELIIPEIEARYVDAPISQTLAITPLLTASDKDQSKQSDHTINYNALYLQKSPNREVVSDLFYGQQAYFKEPDTIEELSLRFYRNSVPVAKLSEKISELSFTLSDPKLSEDFPNMKTPAAYFERMKTNLLDCLLMQISPAQLFADYAEYYEAVKASLRVQKSFKALSSELADKTFQSLWSDMINPLAQLFEDNKSELTKTLPNTVSSPELVSTISARLDKITLLMRIFQNTQHGAISSVDESLQQTSQVIAYAQKTVSHPLVFREALDSWPEYNEIESSALQAMQLPKLLEYFLPFIRCEINANDFVSQTTPLLNEEHLSELTAFRDAWFINLQYIEDNSLDHLWPQQAKKIIDRTRFALLLINEKIKTFESKHKLEALSIEDIIAADMKDWVELLPIGWPGKDGISSAGIRDEDFSRSVGYGHLTELQFIDCLKGKFAKKISRNEESNDPTSFNCVSTLINFLINPQYGYYRFFCAVNKESDELDYPIKAYSDHDPLNRLLLVLQHISDAAAKKMAVSPSRTAPEEVGPLLDSQEQLKHIQDIADQARMALSDFLTAAPTHEEWHAKENHVPINYISKRLYRLPPKPEFSLAQRHLSEAALEIFKSSQDPTSRFDEHITKHNLSEWATQAIANSADLPPQIFKLYETTLANAPEPEGEDYGDWLIKTQRAGGMSYLMGRLIERLDHEPDTDDKLHHEAIKKWVENTPIEEIKKYIADHTQFVKVEKNPNLSEEHLEETLWIIGYMKLCLQTNIRAMNLVDATYDNEIRQNEMDAYLLTLSKDEAMNLLKKCQTQIGFPADSSSADLLTASGNGLDQNEYRQLLERIDVRDNDGKARKQLERRMSLLSNIEPQSDTCIFNTTERLYAVYYLSNPTPTDLEVFREQLMRSVDDYRKEYPYYDDLIDQPNFQNVEDFFGGHNPKLPFAPLSEDERQLFYQINLTYVNENYASLSKAWLTLNQIEMFAVSDNDSTSSFWAWLHSQLYFDPQDLQKAISLDPSSDQKTTLIQVLDDHLVEILEFNANKLDPRFSFVIKTTLEKVISHLDNEHRQVFIELHKALFEPFDRLSPEQARKHSKFNPYGFEVIENLPKRDALSEILNGAHFKNIMLLNNLDHLPQENNREISNDINRMLSSLITMLEITSFPEDEAQAMAEGLISQTWTNQDALVILARYFPTLKTELLTAKTTNPNSIKIDSALLSERLSMIENRLPSLISEQQAISLLQSMNELLQIPHADLTLPIPQYRLWSNLTEQEQTILIEYFTTLNQISEDLKLIPHDFDSLGFDKRQKILALSKWSALIIPLNIGMPLAPDYFSVSPELAPDETIHKLLSDMGTYSKHLDTFGTDLAELLTTKIHVLDEDIFAPGALSLKHFKNAKDLNWNEVLIAQAFLEHLKLYFQSQPVGLSPLENKTLLTCLAKESHLVEIKRQNIEELQQLFAHPGENISALK
jgi:hypothetical protein